MKRVVAVKRLLTVLVLGAICSSANAASSGWYAGANVGGETASMKTHEQTSSTDTIYSHYMGGYTVEAKVGYDAFLTSHFVLGSELFANLSSSSMVWQHNDGSGQREFKNNNDYGLSLLPGWQFSNLNRVYARLGWSSSAFSHETNDPATLGPAFHNIRRDGLLTGVGFLHNLSNAWALDAEYTHIHYSKITQYYDTTMATFQPNVDEFTLGARYFIAAPQATTTGNAQAQMGVDNWYVGATGAVSRADVEIDTPSLGSLQARSVDGLLGGLHVGYRKALNSLFVLGGEAFTTVNSAKTNYSLTASGTEYTYEFKELGSFGVSLLPGLRLNSSGLLYSRMGYINSHFKRTGETDGFGGNFDKHQNGFELGAGYELAVTDNWSILGEYDHSYYKTIKTFVSNTQYNYKLSDNQYNIGVNYSF